MYKRTKYTEEEKYEILKEYENGLDLYYKSVIVYALEHSNNNN
ncbi:hypothetical protein [Clostridium sporogenes]|nr:hypothetical protein [Clostridium sporogenes]